MQEFLNTRWQKLMERAVAEDWPCLPSPPDPRDWPLSQIARVPTELPAAVRLDHLVPRVPDQGQCGSCVGKASMNILNAFYNYKKTLPPSGLSSLYIYARCKQEDGIPDREGTYPRVALKVMQKEGAPPASLLPYSLLNQQACLKFPAITQEHRQAALPFRIKAYAALNGLQEIKQALAAGKLVLAGVLVTSTNWIDDAKDGGFIGKPEGWIYGGHAVMLCGYDDRLSKHGYTGFLRGVNSWGDWWGDKGFFWLSYDFCNWESDLGMPALWEAWAVEIENLPVPDEPDSPPEDEQGIIDIWIDSPIAEVNGVKVQIDPTNPLVAPRILQARTMVPVRFVSECLGATVEWHERERRVRIKKGVNK